MSEQISLEAFAEECLSIRSQCVSLVHDIKYCRDNAIDSCAAQQIYDKLMGHLNNEDKIIEILQFAHYEAHKLRHEAMRRDLFTQYTLHAERKQPHLLLSGLSKILTDWLYSHVVREDNAWFSLLHQRVLLG